jgi:glycosyltransferase involved in cell wall biosynthesis
MEVIPNGIDVDVFRPDAKCGADIRERLRIPPSARVVGLIGRFHPHKDHPCFFRAAARIARSLPDCHFILGGAGVDRNNPVLVELERECNLNGRCHLLGQQQNMQAIYNTLDVLVSSSITEAFPLVLGEAMAAGKPCVATDVGDCRLIVGDTGSIVPPGDFNALAHACFDLLQLGSEELVKRGHDCRRRIVSLFSLKAAVERYQALYLDCARSSDCAPGWLRHAEIDLGN